MQYVANMPRPAVPTPAKPRLLAALKAAHEAHLAIVSAGDAPDEVVQQAQEMWDRLLELTAIWRAEYEFERWWSHTYYHRLYGRHWETVGGGPSEGRKLGQIVRFPDDPTNRPLT